MRRVRAIMLTIGIALTYMIAGSVYAQQATPPAPATTPAPANAQGKKTEQKKENLEVKKEIYYYQSEALGRRDPFMSIITIKQKEEKKEISAPPLEKYDLSQMKLFAVVLTQNQQYAMVLLPDGKYYTVLKGDKIGIHDGYVSSMTLSTVTVIESIKDYKGRIQKKEVLLRLREEEGQ